MSFTPRRTATQQLSPITQLAAAVAELNLDGELLDLSQGVPAYGPPAAVTERIHGLAANPKAYAYTPRMGLPSLREAFAEQLSTQYDGRVLTENVLVTAGCNQAFCAAISAIADVGDEVAICDPFYFNYDMWLKNQGIVPRYVALDDSYVPTVDRVRSALTPRTRAIVVISPGNPTGAVIPPARLSELADLARATKTFLLIDETYRCFGPDMPPHRLFKDANWVDSVVSVHSFSKQYAIPGCRVGAAIAGPALLAEMSKILDCVAICAPRMGQEAVIAGIRSGGAWLTERVGEVAANRQRLTDLLDSAPGGFTLQSCGGFFAWLQHPFDISSADLVRVLVREHGILALPGTVFSRSGHRHLRISCAALTDADTAALGFALRELARAA